MNVQDVLFGYGTVGKASAHAFQIDYCIDWQHQSYHYLTNPFPPLDSFNYIWICVPTPEKSDGSCDTSIVESIICDHASLEKIFILRSTVIPTTASCLAKKYKVDIVSFPEFLSERTAAADIHNPWFCVVGETATSSFIHDHFHYFHDKKLFLTTNTTAEMVKYAINVLFASLVVFGNQLYDICPDYEIVKDILAAIPWAQQHHLNVLQDSYRGFAGKCLIKDLNAFNQAYNLPLFKMVAELNANLLCKELVSLLDK